MNAEYLSKLKDAQIPAIMVQGDQDTVVPPTYARQWIESMKEIGMTYKYVQLPVGDHGTVIGNGSHAGHFQVLRRKHTKSKAK